MCSVGNLANKKTEGQNSPAGPTTSNREAGARPQSFHAYRAYHWVHCLSGGSFTPEAKFTSPEEAPAGSLWPLAQPAQLKGPLMPGRM